MSRALKSLLGQESAGALHVLRGHLPWGEARGQGLWRGAHALWGQGLWRGAHAPSQAYSHSHPHSQPQLHSKGIHLQAEPQASPHPPDTHSQSQTQSQSQSQSQSHSWHRRFLRSIWNALGTSLLLAPPAIAFGLGTWQVQRRRTKAELVEGMQRRLEEAPLEGPQLQRLMVRLGEATAGGDPLPASATPATSAGPADATPTGPSPACRDAEFRRVACQGRWDRRRTVRVGPRARRVHGVSEKGFLLITPLVPPPGAGPPVLVNRGWVPDGWSDAEGLGAQWPQPGQHAPGTVEGGGPSGGRGVEGGTTLPAVEGASDKDTRSWLSWLVPQGTPQGKAGASRSGEEQGEAVRVEGVLRGSEHPNMFVPLNEPEAGQWFYIDVPALARACGLPESTLLVEATSQETAPLQAPGVGHGTARPEEGVPVGPEGEVWGGEGGAPRKYPIPRDLEGLVRMPVMPQDHLNYALTWYTLSAATSFMAYLRLRSSRRIGRVAPR